MKRDEPGAGGGSPAAGEAAGPWLRSRWERDTRYYELLLGQDLWGDWVLTRVWGRRGTALGQIRHEACASYADGAARHAAAEAVRRKRGYLRRED